MNPLDLKVGEIIIGPAGTCFRGRLVRIKRIDKNSNGDVSELIYDHITPDGEFVSSASCTCYNSFKDINYFNLIPNKQNKFGITQMLNAMMKKLLDKDTKTLIKAGYIDGNLLPTQKGKEALEAVLIEANKEELLKMAAEEIEEAKEEK